MTLKEYCDSLPEEKLLALALKLCERAYPIWEDYCKTGNLTYRDIVVGVSHTIEERLLSEILDICRRLQTDPDLFDKEKARLMNEILEPVTALQDEDWILPDTVKKVFYSVYNLLRGLERKETGFGELSHYLSVNQAVDALYSDGVLSVEEIKKLIYEDNPV